MFSFQCLLLSCDLFPLTFNESNYHILNSLHNYPVSKIPVYSIAIRRRAVRADVHGLHARAAGCWLGCSVSVRVPATPAVGTANPLVFILTKDPASFPCHVLLNLSTSSDVVRRRSPFCWTVAGHLPREPCRRLPRRGRRFRREPAVPAAA